MKLIKTTFFSGIVSIVRLFSGFISNKVAALILGPSGVALLGAFTNFITITLTFANGAINTGVVKFSAEYHNDEIKTKSLINTALKISLFCSLITSGIIILFSKEFSFLIFKTENYSTILIAFGISIFLYALNTIILAVLNGQKEIRKFTIINIIGSILSLFITLISVYYFKVSGALYALFLSQTLVFFVSLYFVRKLNWFGYIDIRLPLNKKILKDLSHYSLMALVTALTVPISQILIRDNVIMNYGLESAGIWQGMNRISDSYLMLITTSLSVYYLPKLASLNSNVEIKNEIFHVFKFLLPLLLLSCLVIYLFKKRIISLLFSEQFSIMENLFSYQLIGDIFKIISWLLGYIMLAKSMTIQYIFSEIIFSVTYVLLTMILSDNYGFIGYTMAFALNYLIYLFFMLYTFRKIIFNRNI